MRSAKEREKVGALNATIVMGMVTLDVTALTSSTPKEEVKEGVMEERREPKSGYKVYPNVNPQGTKGGKP